MAGLYRAVARPCKDKDDPARWKWRMTVLTTTVIFRPHRMTGDLRVCLVDVVRDSHSELRRSELNGPRHTSTARASGRPRRPVPGRPGGQFGPKDQAAYDAKLATLGRDGFYGSTPAPEFHEWSASDFVPGGDGHEVVADGRGRSDADEAVDVPDRLGPSVVSAQGRPNAEFPTIGSVVFSVHAPIGSLHRNVSAECGPHFHRPRGAASMQPIRSVPPSGERTVKR